MQKIMFNEQFGLQQATFDGTKTMTRRAVPDKTLEEWYNLEEDYRMAAPAGIPCYLEPMEEFLIKKAEYHVGEIVAIAQMYSQLVANGHLTEDGNLSLMHSEGWGNKMYVKAKLMQRHVKITGIKVEGLAGISDEDCLKEGIYELKLCESEKCVYTFQGDRYGMWKTPYLAYKELIDRLNKRGYFESNPMVYAYTYELVD